MVSDLFTCRIGNAEFLPDGEMQIADLRRSADRKFGISGKIRFANA